MAQDWDSNIPSSSTNIFQDNVNSRKNEESLRSTFSGTSSPLNPVVGQKYYNTTDNKTYVFTANGVWKEDGDGSTISSEVKLSRGSLTSLDDRLAVSINPDGTLKTNVTANLSEFIQTTLVITYISSNAFSVPEDQTSTFTVNRQIRATLGSSYVYSAVSSVSYNANTNATTITLKDSVLDSSLQHIAYGIIQRVGAESLNFSSDLVTGKTTKEAIENVHSEAMSNAVLWSIILG